MTRAVKVFAENRAAAEAMGAVWVGPGSAWWPRRSQGPADDAKRLATMLKTQPAIAKAAREVLAGRQLADGTDAADDSVAAILAARAGEREAPSTPADGGSESARGSARHG